MNFEEYGIRIDQCSRFLQGDSYLPRLFKNRFMSIKHLREGVLTFPESRDKNHGYIVVIRY